MSVWSYINLILSLKLLTTAQSDLLTALKGEGSTRVKALLPFVGATPFDVTRGERLL
ncbi:hypothetical protein GWK48_02475 [Metallosphaera tengchongensis]|uniref:Uncharacterized protein n=1 Tax=Metallosphaera tengchongensis TaxID=1532350 RepID=A0A6N0NUI4_9CREN|nr:hypothetical protein [Metallosphaera tengchongensis]QKQ99408.1 hypothetical protein GWK48_02475 [Metallosphaera tengchongensis]